MSYWEHNMLKAKLAEGEYWKNIIRNLSDDEEKSHIYFHMPKQYTLPLALDIDIKKHITRHTI